MKEVTGLDQIIGIVLVCWPLPLWMNLEKGLSAPTEGKGNMVRLVPPPVMTLTELQVKWTLQPRFSPYCLPILDENKNSNGAQNSHRIQAYLGPKVRCC